MWIMYIHVVIFSFYRQFISLQGFVQHSEEQQQGGGMLGNAMTGGISNMVENANNSLVAAGIPTWNLGPYQVRPIVTVATVLAVMFLGITGLLLAAFIFFISNLGGGGAGSNNTGGNQNSGGQTTGGQVSRGPNSPQSGRTSSHHSSTQSGGSSRNIFGGTGQKLGR